MEDMLNELAATLGRTTLLASATAAIVLLLLRFSGCRSPGLHRAACIAALLQGWMVWRCAVEIPIFEPCEASAPLAIQPTHGATPPDAADEFEPAAPHDAGSAWTLDPSWLLVMVWATGGMAAATRFIVIYVRFVRALPSGLPVDACWRDEWLTAQRELGVGRAIPLRVVVDEIGPLLCRLPRGCELIVPRSFWSRFDARQRRLILRHEAAHARRGDLHWACIAQLLAWPQWFNPLLWRIVQRFDEAGEWSCDDAATWGDGTSAVAYARSLLELAALPRRPATAHASASGGLLAHRFRRLFSSHVKEDGVMKRSMVAIVLLAALVCGGVQVKLTAEEPDKRQLAPEAPSPQNESDEPVILITLRLIERQAKSKEDAPAKAPTAPPAKALEKPQIFASPADAERLKLPRAKEVPVPAARAVPIEPKIERHTLAVSMLDPQHVREYLQLVESDKTLNKLSAPRVITLDEQEATVELADERRFVIGFDNDQPKVKNVAEGFKFEVKPKLLAGNRIRVELGYSASRVDRVARSSVRVPGHKRPQVVEIPTVSQRGHRLTIEMVDGQTALVGGLLPADSTRQQTLLLTAQRLEPQVAQQPKAPPARQEE